VTDSEAFGINASGQVVGSCRGTGRAGRRAFVYTKEPGAVDLNQQVDPAQHWQLRMALAINDAGQIAGEGLHKGQERGFLLTPKRGK
jgi:probable HAF family extracellular repeat protein